MIHLNTIIEVGDNTGAKLVKCVNTGMGKRSSARLGSIIKVSIYKNDDSKNLIKKKKVYRAIVINSCQKKNNGKGIYQKWNINRVLMLNERLNFLGTKIYGSICKELRVKKKNDISRSSIVSYAHSYA